MEDYVDSVGGARFVTKLDLLKGYWQVPLTERAKEISAFVTPDDFLQYTVIAFGMRNVPATFQSLMNVVLSGLSFCEAYRSESWSEHMEHLRALCLLYRGFILFHAPSNPSARAGIRMYRNADNTNTYLDTGIVD